VKTRASVKIKNVGNNDVNSFTTGRTCSNNNPGVLVVIMIMNRSVLTDLKEFFQSWPSEEKHTVSPILLLGYVSSANWVAGVSSAVCARPNCHTLTLSQGTPGGDASLAA
jgi:hypothetical protein